MTREDAIKNLKELRDEVYNDDGTEYTNLECRNLLAMYDMAIASLSEHRWIPVTERLPEELVPVNITWVNHNPESYYKHITDKPFTATGVYFNGQWYWWSTLCTDMLAEYGRNYSDMCDDDVEITAWMPLPKPYEEGAEE